ncbi:MAG: tRNA (adenosine(37)-N6)-dimethylallyltransferase MiaA [Patescibacteria group bacterium]
MATLKKTKLVVILGPTASGKTKLAAALARRFRGEIISADSRQVFRGLDIGTGKDLKDYGRVPYHLIDVASPKTPFNVAKYQKLAQRAIEDVWRRGRLPLLVGGTGLYLDAVAKGFIFPPIVKSQAARDKIRAKLDKLALPRLLAELKKIDPPAYTKIDKKNRRRVQRALEIFYETGLTKSQAECCSPPAYEILTLGVKFPVAELYRRIDGRLSARLKEGLIEEVRRLHQSGASWKKLEELGLEYRFVARYLRGLITREELIEQLRQAIHHFAKRQLTWFKRDQSIHWIKDKQQAAKIIEKFIQK